MIGHAEISAGSRDRKTIFHLLRRNAMGANWNRRYGSELDRESCGVTTIMRIGRENAMGAN